MSHLLPCAAVALCRALAQKLQVPLLVVDAATLRLDSDEAKEGGATDDMFDRPTYPGDPFDLSGELLKLQGWLHVTSQ